MSASEGERPHPSLFEVFPAESHDTMIVKWPDRHWDIASDFAVAAKRLASTFHGDPADDSLLHPFLYLYRHAIESSMKDLIRETAALRRLRGEDRADVHEKKVDKRLRNELRHDLAKILALLDNQMAAAGFSPLPDDVRNALSLIIEADPKGNSFRFPSDYLDTNRIDFPKLAAMLGEVYSMIEGGRAMVDDASQIEADVRADYAAERAYYNDQDSY